MKNRRDKLDIVFSNLVRERAGWCCEKCGKACEGSTRLDCSHFFSRRKASTRWHPDNAAAHCFSCHQYLGENPVVFKTWIEGHLGSELMRKVWREAGQIRKFSKGDKERIHTEMKAELERLKSLRNQGMTGRLVFRIPTVERTVSIEHAGKVS